VEKERKASGGERVFSEGVDKAAEVVGGSGERGARLVARASFWRRTAAAAGGGGGGAGGAARQLRVSGSAVRPARRPQGRAFPPLRVSSSLPVDWCGGWLLARLAFA
jgi:hypothetical protein